jgi:isopenicillin-N N-acyltransferase-like protein
MSNSGVHQDQPLEVGGFPRIRISGKRFDRGQQLGQKTADRIKKNLHLYRTIFRYYAGWEWEHVVKHSMAYRPFVMEYEPGYLEELNGIAEGADVNPHDIFALNLRTEIMFAAMNGIDSAECTAFATLPTVTKSGNTLLAQNWDWKPASRETVILLEVEPDNGPAFITVVEAGLLAKAGFNSAGIGIVTNALVSGQDIGSPGVPYHAILRRILESESMSEAIEAIMRQPRASSANYLIATAEGEAISVEAGPGGRAAVSFIQPENGALAHTNHFLSPLSESLGDLTLMELPSSPSRLQRAKSLMKSSIGQFDVEYAMSILRDHSGYPKSVCAHADPNDEPLQSYVTVASLIMDLKQRTLWLSSGNPCETIYQRFNYETMAENN